MVSCPICTDYCFPENTHISCGNCNNIICKSCYNNFYNITRFEPGNIINVNKLYCMLCRQLSNYISLDDEIINIIKDDKCKNIGKCKYCLKYNNLENNNCVDELQNSVNMDSKNYICEKCQITNIAQGPKCKMGITKINGCNHMKCFCKHEFCWKCKMNWNLITDLQVHYNSLCC